MSLNRDVAILFAGSFSSAQSRLRVCDPMAGSGVRSARYLLETPNVDVVVAADKDEQAVISAKRTMRLNGLEGRSMVTCDDANALLSKYAADRFDLIDLDPFGSPAPFFEATLRATRAGGVIAATATDMGPLSGARATACRRKYGVSTVRTEFEQEVAVRALTSCLVSIAARLELGIDLVFSHATDHYARIYAKVSKGRKAANQSLRNLGYIIHCSHCLFRSTSNSISSVADECANCEGNTQAGGPYWLGPLWDREIVKFMIQRTPTLQSSRLSDVQRMLGLIEDELECPSFYYTTDSIASVYHTKPPSHSWLIESLRDGGYQAARTHFDRAGFRTNAPLPSIVASFLTFSEKS